MKIDKIKVLKVLTSSVGLVVKSLFSPNKFWCDVTNACVYIKRLLIPTNDDNDEINMRYKKVFINQRAYLISVDTGSYFISIIKAS